MLLSAEIVAPTPVGITNSILPSLSIATTAAQSPAANTPPLSGKKTSDSTAEQFFYKSRKLSSESGSALAESLQDKLGPQLVQPRSRYSSPVVSSLVSEHKKDSDGIGLLGLKMNRSGTNLSALNHPSRSNSFTDAPHRSRGSGSKPFLGLALNNNSSHSLVIAEEDELENAPGEAGYFDLSENAAEEKLAPYGGFSRPNLESSFLNEDNVFEHAPWKIVRTEQGNGSLYNAVRNAREKGVVKNRKWVGALSLPTDAIPEKVLEKVVSSMSKDYNCEPVIVDDMTFHGHYNSFCKQILWPTLHYQIPDDPKSKAFEDHSYHYYKLLNQMVADKIVEIYKKENSGLEPDDPENVIWIHDYHLLLVPKMVREQLPQAKIGLFLHVSFPSSEVFRCLAQRKALLEGMLGANCISFQTEEYVRHFLQTCSRLLLSDANEFGLIHDGIFTKVNMIPVGIDSDELEKVLKSDAVVEWKQMIRERWKDQRLIVSRDKLDKLRGVKQKLLAYEKFLLKNPDFVYTTSLIQIFIGSSDDLNYEAEVMQIASRINSLTENISDIQPVVILNKDIHFEQYLALQSEADVFIVSSMREGLNLTCHEFIIASKDKKSPLVLSEFTGSSPLLDCDGNGAILINPWDQVGFCEAIKSALTMEGKEKELRWKNCYDKVTKHDSLSWIKTCLQSVNRAWKLDKEKSLANKNPFNAEVFKKFYTSSSGGRLFYFNLDTPAAHNSLFGSQSGPSKGYLEYSRIGRLLQELISDPKNHVYVGSIIRRSELELLFKNVINIGLIAEGGGFVRLIGSSNWISVYEEDEVANWKPQVSLLIHAKVERLPGSIAVIEECTIRLVADSSMVIDQKRCMDVMGDVMQHINDAFEEVGVHATIINNSVVVQQKDIALRAMNFILTYYTTEMDAKGLTKQWNLKPVKSTTDTIFNHISTDSINYEKERERKGDLVTSFFFSGGLNPMDESIYEYVNNLTKDGTIKDAITVSVHGERDETRTSASYTALGQNELFGIISRYKRA